MNLDPTLTAIAVGCWILAIVIALVVLAADLIPASRRPAPDYDGQVTWTDPPTGPIAVRYLPDVEVDPAHRAARIRSAVEAQAQRRAGLQRHLARLLDAASEVRAQLRANTEADTTPTPVVLDEQPTGGER